MSRAIKLELYRLRRNKYPWIILILSSLMIIGSVYMTKVDYHYYINDKAALENLKINFTQINWGIYVGSVIPDWLDLGYIPITELFMRNIQSKILLMFQTVFIVMYIGDELKSSFLKNINQVFPKKNRANFRKSNNNMYIYIRNIYYQFYYYVIIILYYGRIFEIHRNRNIHKIYTRRIFIIYYI